MCLLSPAKTLTTCFSFKLSYIKTAVFLLVTFICIFSLCSCRIVSLGGNYKLRKAEELLRQEKYDEAISTYKEHMESRSKVKDKPEWENPYFYYLLIGDIELRRGNVDKALEAYKTAQENNIHPSLISDRYRFVGAWYEEHGEPLKALEVLKTHRDLDTLLFDAMMDRISKDIINGQQPALAPLNPQK